MRRKRAAEQPGRAPPTNIARTARVTILSAPRPRLRRPTIAGQDLQPIVLARNLHPNADWRKAARLGHDVINAGRPATASIRLSRPTSANTSSSFAASTRAISSRPPSISASSRSHRPSHRGVECQRYRRRPRNGARQDARGARQGRHAAYRQSHLGTVALGRLRTEADPRRAWAARAPYSCGRRRD